jgi:hypothetical protein
MLVALRKQVQTGQRVTVPARVEDQATRFRVRPAKEPSAASLDPLALLVRNGHLRKPSETFVRRAQEKSRSRSEMSATAKSRDDGEPNTGLRHPACE